MKTILVPIDLSPVTQRVTKAACALAKQIGGRVVLLHAVFPAPVQLHGYGFAAKQVAGMLKALEHRAARQLLNFGRECRKSGAAVQVVQRTGTPVEAILEKARTLKADYIVLGSHGHGAAYDLLVGSTAQGVLRRTSCPVLVVPMSKRRAKR